METSDNKIKYFQYGFAFVAAIMVFNAYKSMELRNHEANISEKKDLIKIVDKSIETQLKALILIDKTVSNYEKDSINSGISISDNAASDK